MSTDPIRCRYSDCPEGHPVGEDDDPVTCPTCRSDLDLDCGDDYLLHLAELGIEPFEGEDHGKG